ncbi:hypothetical protein MASR2M79_05630 [Aminivibrio sp.]
MILDAVIDYLPSPVDLPPIVATDPRTMEQVERETSIAAPFTALAFKISVDPFVGRLVFTRIYQALWSRTTVFNPVSNSRERVGRILRMHANKRKSSTRRQRA